MRLKLIILNFLFFVTATNAFAQVTELAELKPVQAGGFVGIVSPPFPSVFGVNPMIEFMGIARIFVGLDILKFSQWFFSFKGAEVTSGYGILLKYPFFWISPVAGIQFTRNLTTGEVTKYYGDLETNATYQNIFIGAETKIMESFFIGAGLNIPRSKREGENRFHAVTGFYPYLHLGAVIF